MNEEQLNKIAEERYPDMSNIMGSEERQTNRVVISAFKSGYHLRDTEVEGLKAEVGRLRKEIEMLEIKIDDLLTYENK